MSVDTPQKNLESAIKLYSELQQATQKAWKETEFLQLSRKLKVTKELLNSVNDDLKELYNKVVDKTQDNNELDTTPQQEWDDKTDTRFINTHKWNNTRKEARVKRQSDRKEEKIERIVRRAWFDGIDGLVAAVHKLSTEIKSSYPELFGYADYEKNKQEAQKLIESWVVNEDNIKQWYEAEIKAGKSPESAAKTIINDAYKKSTNLLEDKLNFDSGVAKATVIGLAIWWILKWYPAIRDMFPSGIAGFLLMWLTAYAAAKNIPGDKVIDAYEWVFGKIDGRPRWWVDAITPESQLSYMKLENSDFQNGQLFFKWLNKYLNNPSDVAIMQIYYTKDKDGKSSFNIKQFIDDYEAGVIDYQWSKIVNYDLRKHLKISPESDLFMSFTAARVDSPNGDKKVSAEILAFLYGITGSYGWWSLDSVKTILDQHDTYKQINETRYHILRNAGYMMNPEKWDKRLEIDNILNIKTRDKDYSLSVEDLVSLQTLIDDETLIEVGTTGAVGFKLNDILNEESPILSNITDKKNTITALTTWFMSAIDMIPEEQKKFIRLVVVDKVLYYQHDIPGNWFKGVKIPLQVGWDVNISLLSLAWHNENSIDPMWWQRIFEMAEYEATLIQLYAGQANPWTKDSLYFSPSWTGSIKFGGANMSNRILKLFNGKNPFGDVHKVPTLLWGNHNMQKSIKDYCTYLNSSQIYGAKLWEWWELPEFYHSFEPGVSWLHEVNNVWWDVNAIKNKLIESWDNELATRIQQGKLKILDKWNETITIERTDEGKETVRMNIVQMPNNPNRRSLQYYKNGALTQFPNNVSYQWLESADKCVRLADKLLWVQIRCQNRGNVNFHNPFFLKTKETMALWWTKLRQSDWDRGIYFIDDKVNNVPFTNSRGQDAVRESFQKAKLILSHDEIATLVPDPDHFDGYIVDMINNMSDTKNPKKSQRFAWETGRPKDDNKIIYETVLGKTLSVIDNVAKKSAGMLRWWVEDIGDEVVDTAKNISTKVLDTIYNDGQPRDFNKYMLYDVDNKKQLTISELKTKYNSPTQAQDYVCNKVIKYWPFAWWFTMINYLMSGKSDYKDRHGVAQSQLSFDDAFAVVCDIDPRFKAWFEEWKIDGALKRLWFIDGWAKDDLWWWHDIIKEYYNANHATLETWFSMEVIKSQLISMGNDGVWLLKDWIHGAIKMTWSAITEVWTTTGDVLRNSPWWIQAWWIILAVGKAISWIIPFN